MNLETNNAHARIETVFVFNKADDAFFEVGSDGKPKSDPEDWHYVRIELVGQHALATEVLKVIQAAIKAQRDWKIATGKR